MEKTKGKPRMKLLGGIMTKEYTKLSYRYSELKATAQRGTKWRHHSQNLPTEAEN